MLQLSRVSLRELEFDGTKLYCDYRTLFTTNFIVFFLSFYKLPNLFCFLWHLIYHFLFFYVYLFFWTKKNYSPPSLSKLLSFCTLDNNNNTKKRLLNTYFYSKKVLLNWLIANIRLVITRTPRNIVCNCGNKIQPIQVFYYC